MTTEQQSEGGDTAIPATGNRMKSHDRYDTFLEVSTGDGNLAGEREVHLLIRSNNGEFAQGWFRLSDLGAALTSPPGRDI